MFVLPTPHFFVRLQSLSERQGLKIHYNYPRTIMHRLQLCRCPTCCVISVVKEVSFCSIIRAQMLQTVRPVLRTICGGKTDPDPRIPLFTEGPELGVLRRSQKNLPFASSSELKQPFLGSWGHLGTPYLSEQVENFGSPLMFQTLLRSLRLPPRSGRRTAPCSWTCHHLSSSTR